MAYVVPRRRKPWRPKSWPIKIARADNRTKAANKPVRKVVNKVVNKAAKAGRTVSRTAKTNNVRKSNVSSENRSIPKRE